MVWAQSRQCHSRLSQGVSVATLTGQAPDTSFGGENNVGGKWRLGAVSGAAKQSVPHGSEHVSEPNNSFRPLKMYSVIKTLLMSTFPKYFSLKKLASSFWSSLQVDQDIEHSS